MKTEINLKEQGKNQDIKMLLLPVIPKGKIQAISGQFPQLPVLSRESISPPFQKNSVKKRLFQDLRKMELSWILSVESGQLSM